MYTFETPTFIDYYNNSGPDIHIKPHKALLFLIKNAQITGGTYSRLNEI